MLAVPELPKAGLTQPRAAPPATVWSTSPRVSQAPLPVLTAAKGKEGGGPLWPQGGSLQGHRGRRGDKGGKRGDGTRTGRPEQG